MQRIVIEHDFTAPVERVFAFLSEHENLGTIFPGIKIKRIADGEDSRNGVGSARRMSIAGILPPFVETTTKVIPNELIEYRITKGGPLKDHLGQMRFSSRPDGGTHLQYEISFGSKIPGVAAIVAKGLPGGIKKGLPKVDRLA